MLEKIKQLYTYNFALHRRVWDSIMQLSDAQFVEGVDYSIGSLRNHCVHLISVDERWIARVAGQKVSEPLHYEHFPTRALVRTKWDAVENTVMYYINNTLTEADIDRTVQYQTSSHGARENKAWQILLHVVNHGADHRAQMLPILERMGVPTFDQDYMIYLWDNEIS